MQARYRQRSGRYVGFMYGRSQLRTTDYQSILLSGCAGPPLRMDSRGLPLGAGDAMPAPGKFIAMGGGAPKADGV